MDATFTRTKKFNTTKNYHPNFLDKVPEQRRKKLMKYVDGVKDKLGQVLLARVKEEKKRLFNQ